MKDNIKVAISSDFLTAFARLPRQVQGKNCTERVFGFCKSARRCWYWQNRSCHA